MPQIPPEFKANYEEGRSYVVDGKLLNAIIRWLTTRRLVAGDGITATETVNGEVWSVDGDDIGVADAACGFGEIYLDGSDTYLRGGVISAGADHHNLDDYLISTASDGESLLWLTITIVATTADGVLMPGIDSSSSASIATGTSYPDSDIPTADTPTATIIVPLGLVSVVSGVATYRHDGPCSPVNLTHCPGQVSY